MKCFIVIAFLLISTNWYAATIVVTNTNDTGAGSLRDQIALANDGDTVRFSPSLLAGGTSSIELSYRITLNKSLTICGLYNSTDTLYISGGNSVQAFRIDATSNFYFDSVAIINCKGDWGGAIRFTNSDSLFISNSTFRNNSVTQGGGAIYDNGNDYLRVSNSIIEHNTAVFNGGGMYSGSIYNVLIENSTFSNNEAENGNAGGVYIHGQAFIENTTISYNECGDIGGGLYVWNSNANITNSTISHNVAAEEAGGVYSTWVRLNHSIISNNTAKYGGGIRFHEKLIVNNNSELSYNVATVDGGGAYATQGTDSIAINHSTVSYNSAGLKGGGIYSYASSGSLSYTRIELNYATISYNTATQHGGGIHSSAYFSAFVPINVYHSKISHNSANHNSGTGSGGGIYSYGSVSPSYITINNSTINNNLGYSGGGIYSFGSGSTVNINTSTISSNVADVIGGGIYGHSNSTTNAISLYNSTLFMNTANTTANNLRSNTLDAHGSIVFHSSPTDNMEITTLNSTGYNVFSDASLAGNHMTDSLNVDGTQLDLGPLQDNGGFTRTHAPGFNSIATDAGDPTDLTDAQNGPIDGIRERGAAEGNCNSYVLEEVISCGNYTWPYNGITYVSDTLIHDTLVGVNVNGCDSITTLQLSIKGPTSSLESVVTCNSYLWTQNGQTYVNDTIVSDTLVDGNMYGCDSIVFLDLTLQDNAIPIVDVISLTDVVDECPVMSITPPTATDDCAGSVSGTTSTSFPISTSTTIVWSYDDGNGNTTTQTQEVIINPIDNSVSQLGNSFVAAVSGYSYQWVDCNNGNAPIPGATSQGYTPVESGSYAVEISNGRCKVTSACLPMAVGISEANKAIGLHVYPNPFDHSVFIQVESPTDVEIYVHDNLGRVVHRETSSKRSSIIDLSHLDSGLYHIRVNNETGYSVRSIVKQ